MVRDLPTLPRQLAQLLPKERVHGSLRLGRRPLRLRRLSRHIALPHPRQRVHGSRGVGGAVGGGMACSQV